MTIKVTLPLPPTLSKATSNKVRGKGRFKTAEAHAWELEAGWLLNGKGNITGDVEVYYGIYYKDHRKQDLANREKLTSDILTKHGLIEDDCKIVKMTLEKLGVDKENPRIEIEIKQCNT